MLANQRDELVGCDQECNCIDKPKQSQNNKPRQPIGISKREETLKHILVIHLLSEEETLNVEYRMKLAIGIRKSSPRYCQGGESNSRPRAYESPALPLSYPGEIGGEKGQSREIGCQRGLTPRTGLPLPLPLTLTLGFRSNGRK